MQVVPRSPEDAERAPGFFERRSALVLLLLVGAAVLVLVSLRPLTRSEIRYVEAGREMVRGGDWIVPHLAYVPYFEKPILAYWIEAASQAAFGEGAVATRLVAIGPCVAMLWLTYLFGRSLRGRTFGVGAAALLLSSIYFIGMGSAATTDPLFAACLVAAWYAFRRHDVEPASGWIWVFWTALGLGALTKGPLALVLVGVSIGAYLALSGRLRDVLATRPLRGVAVVVAINLPWTLLVWRRDPRFLEFFYVRQNFQAFFDGRVNHPGPPWYYVPWIVAAFFPFALIAACALGHGLWTTFAESGRRLRGRAAPQAAADADAGRLYVACMLLPPLLFLSVSSSKLGTYLLPLMPAAALVVAGWIADRIARPCGVLRWGMLAQCVALAVALPVATHLALAKLGVADKISSEGLLVGASAATMAVGCLVASVEMARRRILSGMVVAAAATTGAVLVVLPAIESLASDADASPLMPKLVAAWRPGERVILAGPCSEDYAVVFALEERVAIWGPARELGMGHFTEVTPPDVPIPRDDRHDESKPGPYDVGGPKFPLRENPWLFDDARLFSTWRADERAWFVGRPRDVERLRDAGLEMHVIAENDSRVVATNHPAPAER